MIVWFFIVRKDDYHDQEKVEMKDVKKIVLDALPALGMPVLIIGGVRLGWFTPTEAGAFAVVYSILVCSLLYKELGWKEIKAAFLGTGTITATLAIMMGGAQAAGYYMTLAQVPAKIAMALGGLLDHPYLFMMAVMGFLLVMGMIMDITPNILIFSPIFLPIARRAGIDPYFFAFLMCLNFQIGMVTPPVGGILFIGSRIGGITYKDLLIKIWPFVLVIVGILFLILFIPDLYMIPLKWFTG
jgi:tripartite ATP-independent transporter DctM subunit